MGTLRADVGKAPTEDEMLQALVTAAIPEWGVCNAFVLHNNLRSDEAMLNLVSARLGGTDALSALVDRALQSSVDGPPGWAPRGVQV